jgi:lipoprotein-releasing system ATP-binding protein
MADEPTGNLDTANAHALHNLFLELRDKFGQTFIMITHNDTLARMTDRTLTMQDGRIVDEKKNARP